MARFATYYLRYSKELCHNWEDRQQHLAELFAENSKITFGEGNPSAEQKKEGIPYAKIYNHRVYHLHSNQNIIVMQFANSIDIAVESKFEQTITKDEPSLFVIIDNRKDVRTIAIQNRRKAFSAPKKVAEIIQREIHKMLYHKHCYTTEILPEFYPADLFETWEEVQKHTQAMRFPTSEDLTSQEILQKVQQLKSQNKDYFDDSIMSSLIELALEAKKAKYKHMLMVMPQDKQNALYVDKTSSYMKNLITYTSAIGEPVEIVTKDGATLRCFVETEDDRTDKIVHRKFDDALLQMFFNNRKPNGDKAESQDIEKAENELIEMLNQIKHPVEDIEENVEVA